MSNAKDLLFFSWGFILYLKFGKHELYPFDNRLNIFLFKAQPGKPPSSGPNPGGGPMGGPMPGGGPMGGPMPGGGPMPLMGGPMQGGPMPPMMQGKITLYCYQYLYNINLTSYCLYWDTQVVISMCLSEPKFAEKNEFLTKYHTPPNKPKPEMTPA